MTAQSLQVLRDSEQILKPVSPTSRAVINYLRTVYTRFDNTFRHTNRQRFFDLCRDVIDEARPLLQKEPLYQEVKAPCYVFGDLHGNYRDLSYFIDSIITFDDLLYTPCTLLFLGDYVDRGPYGIECVLLLLALKLSRPGQVVLLRGNHEDPLVNGDMGNYGSTSFQSQCIAAFNHKRGMTVWEMFNALIFANLPLAADIDGKIFCAHGGIPRYSGGADTRMEVLRDPNFARLASFSAFDDESTEDMPWMQYACDLCWSDPKEREDTGDMNKYGFAANRRGVGTICFGTTAVDTFLERTGFEYIFRAHQEKSDGLRLSKSARVITIFSTSDYEGHRNGAGVLFVSHTREIRLVIKKAT
ncbi:Serine/threonine-protein phosphatase BSL1-like protein [Diplonema papillatum]|nr:Serine/threonine-protein phosphatase BSL1-like protein [Diplonema papillatum]